MDLSGPEAVRALASLARIALSAEEEARLAPELGRILAAFEVLQRATPAAPPRDASAPPLARRGDEPVPSLGRARLLEAAPETQDGFFRVPKTVGGPP